MVKLICRLENRGGAQKVFRIDEAANTAEIETFDYYTGPSRECIETGVAHARKIYRSLLNQGWNTPEIMGEIRAAEFEDKGGRLTAEYASSHGRMCE